jgi:hypothetical protein
MPFTEISRDRFKELEAAERDLASLESRCAAAEEAVGKKDEALSKGIDCLDSVAEAVSRFYDLKPNSSDMLLVSSEMSQALSLTPASVAQHAEEARVGRVFLAWFESPEVQECRTVASLEAMIHRLSDSADEAQAGAAQMRGALERVFIDSGASFKPANPDYIDLRIPVGDMQAAREALSTSAGRDFLEYHNESEELLRDIIQTPQRMQKMMRREGFALDNLDDRWQKLAFTFYTQLVQQATDAEAILEDGEQ